MEKAGMQRVTETVDADVHYQLSREQWQKNLAEKSRS
jgi:hypothetical protein